MAKYYYDNDSRFVIEDYNNAKPFASFLPGIAGKDGIPMWVYYVNRGQGISSFGIRDKDGAIMEFLPANKAYQAAFTTGFRTFIKITCDGKEEIYEPFSMTAGENGAKQTMVVSEHGFDIEEINGKLGLKTRVSYFLLPNEKFAALIRKVNIVNLSQEKKDMEIIDGMPAIIPYGATNTQMKEISQTMAAFMEVKNVENLIPFYKLRMSAADSAEVETVDAGHFYLAFAEKEGSIDVLKPIVDPVLVFGRNTSLSSPDEFKKNTLKNILENKQITFNKIPCGLFGTAISLDVGKGFDLYSAVGNVDDIGFINSQAKRIADKKYMDAKYHESASVIDELTKGIYTKTSAKLFDAYSKQTYLDNLLRGGYPLVFGEGDDSKVYHVYSRKHGDLERDYNFFSIAPEFYSQGNGSFRDVNQNRRCDVFFNAQVKDFNVITFANLIQADGYNPLVVQGSKFKLRPERAEEVYSLVEEKGKIEEFFKKTFTPGSTIKFIQDKGIILKVPEEEFLNRLMTCSEQLQDAVYGEGYWVDHWTYNMDLIENYLAVYPDKCDDLLFNKKECTYYENHALVLPREEKYVLAHGGKVRQYGALEESKEKKRLINSRKEYNTLLRTGYGKGDIYRSSLYSKLICLAANKFSALDPYGMGVEMEAEKPGWYDALNGLPGIFGSSVPETFEVKRLVKFMIETAVSKDEMTVAVPEEVYEFFTQLEKYYDEYMNSKEADKAYKYWDGTASAREAYREKVKYGFSGAEKTVSLKLVTAILNKFMTKLEEGLSKALAAGNGLYPTYFYYEAEGYELIKDKAGKKKVNQSGYPCVRIKSFKQAVLPLFLEGVVRSLNGRDSVEEARNIYDKVRDTGLYDPKLKMYKVNAALEGVTYEVGRTKAFTPGWLENESIFLHMEYKYLLAVLKSGIYDEFYEDFKNALIPFLKPEIYGRSTLENVSFIASSVNPDESLHGGGFVARLSGTTAEFLNIWNIMMSGQKPFCLKEGQLCLEFKPVLQGWLFDEKNEIEFTFLGKFKVTYHNPRRVDTYGKDAEISHIRLAMFDGAEAEVTGGVIGEQYAKAVRDGNVQKIDIYYK